MKEDETDLILYRSSKDNSLLKFCISSSESRSAPLLVVEPLDYMALDFPFFQNWLGKLSSWLSERKFQPDSEHPVRTRQEPGL